MQPIVVALMASVCFFLYKIIDLAIIWYSETEEDDELEIIWNNEEDKE